MSATPSDNTGDLKSAITNAITLLQKGEFALACEQAEEVLERYPDEINSLFVVAANMRAMGDNKNARQQLQNIVKQAPDFALAQQELGFVYAAMGEILPAIEALQSAVKIEPKLPASWKLMGEMFLIDGDENSANEALNQHLLMSSVEPELIRAVNLFNKGKIGQAEQLCRQFLHDNPTNVTAIRLLAAIGIKVGVYEDAENLLERCLELAPDFYLARLNYANVLSKREKLEQALLQIDKLLESEPDKPALLTLKATILAKMGDYQKALPIYEFLLSNFPPQANISLSHGHALKTIGQRESAISAYRQTISLRPGFGDAYWSLANLKTFRFEETDIEKMHTEIAKPDCALEDYFHLCFALGKALENREIYDEAFQYYKKGNDTKQKQENYDPGHLKDVLHRNKTVCTQSFLANAEPGCQAPDPIFIVGLPRSGSTLLEQILASHSQVDGTKELPNILSLVRRLGGKRKKDDQSLYPEVLMDLTAERLEKYGQEYIDGTRIQRESAPYFIDKMPNNFAHVGLIHLILPNAKIIDARRHPMASCFSGYTQLFARGQAFTYGLSNIGHYYRDYIEIMDHWDEVLPGKVLLMQYEDVVADVETQVRRMLDYCGLPFEQSCLQFHETRRAVRTASSEQVRQPIYSGALEHWRNYESHLDELKEALGPVLDRYPVN
jgi:tetratricopeptide (TPR) repeat protein